MLTDRVDDFLEAEAPGGGAPEDTRLLRCLRDRRASGGDRSGR